MKCPRCAGIELKLADRQGVEIDYCPECRGIWLDRGELDKYTQPEPPPAYQPQYQQSYPQHHDKHHDKHGYGYGSQHGGHHGKKSWLAELFD